MGDDGVDAESLPGNFEDLLAGPVLTMQYEDIAARLLAIEVHLRTATPTELGELVWLRQRNEVLGDLAVALIDAVWKGREKEKKLRMAVLRALGHQSGSNNGIAQ